MQSVAGVSARFRIKGENVLAAKAKLDSVEGGGIIACRRREFGATSFLGQVRELGAEHLGKRVRVADGVNQGSGALDLFERLIEMV